MSTLDDITKEKQRLNVELARVDAQRERLSSQLSELEATERVLARYSKGPASRKTASVQAMKATAPGRSGRLQRAAAAKPANRFGVFAGCGPELEIRRPDLLVRELIHSCVKRPGSRCRRPKINRSATRERWLCH